MRFRWSINILLFLQLNILLRVRGDRQNITQVTEWPTHRRQWPTPQFPQLPGLRQQTPEDIGFVTPGGLGGTKHGGQAGDDAKRFSTKSTTPFRKRRSTKEYVSLDEHCDYLALNCLRSYQTGRLCARSGYWRFFTFKNYCMMDFVNCRARYENINTNKKRLYTKSCKASRFQDLRNQSFKAWQVIHMGDCLKIKPMTEYFAVGYWDSGVMNGYYVLDRDN